MDSSKELDRILKEREKLFNTFLNHYKEMAKEEPRYKRTCAKLQKYKQEFMEGKTFYQVINM